jgi:hypothetical protein
MASISERVRISLRDGGIEDARALLLGERTKIAPAVSELLDCLRCEVLLAEQGGNSREAQNWALAAAGLSLAMSNAQPSLEVASLFQGAAENARDGGDTAIATNLASIALAFAKEVDHTGRISSIEALLVDLRKQTPAT